MQYSESCFSALHLGGVVVVVVVGRGGGEGAQQGPGGGGGAGLVRPRVVGEPGVAC